MRALIPLLALAGTLAACDHTPGSTDGYCDYENVNGTTVAHVPGDYRCAGTKVEVCSYGEDPLKDRPQWVVIEDCGSPTKTGAYGTCTIPPATGVAQCIF